MQQHKKIQGKAEKYCCLRIETKSDLDSIGIIASILNLHETMVMKNGHGKCLKNSDVDFAEMEHFATCPNY